MNKKISGGAGCSATRVDAVQKVTGQAVYGTDIQLPGMLYGRILRSQPSHARLTRIDVSEALRLPGVRAVITGRDLAGIDPYYGPAIKDQPVLAIDLVRYAGEPIAAVAADRLETAEKALGLISPEYEDLPAVHSVEEALAEGAPLVHETFRMAGHFRDLKEIQPVPGTNICHHYKYRQGDVEQGFAQSDRVFEDVYEVPAVQHYSMEPFVVIAESDSEKIKVITATQHPFLVRKELSEIFGIPQSRVDVVVPWIGGAYGSKCYTKLEPLAVCLARRAGRTVKLVLSVDESFHTITRHAARTRVKTGVRRDGTLLAREVEMHLDTGAYADVGPRVAKKAGFRAIGPYRVPNVKIDSYAVHTHKVPAGAYRGYGGPQGAWGVESQMDEIAEWLQIDPLTLRMNNLRRKGEDYTPGDTPLDGELRSSMQAAANGVFWSVASQKPATAKGVAFGLKDGGGTHTVSVASVRVHHDGSVTVNTGSVEMGQGAHTIMTQIVVEELSVPMNRISVGELSTSITPYDQGTSASRTTTLMGHAVQMAARHAREQLVQIASEWWDCPVEEIKLQDGNASHGANSAGLGDLVSHYYGMPGGEVIGVGDYRPASVKGSQGGAIPFWEIGAGAAEVSVDEETGKIDLLQYISVADAGKAINPHLAEAQDEGGAMQGIGHALFESLLYDGGQLLNANLVDYRVPSFEDLPENFGSILIEEGGGPGPYGSKGIGESGVLSVAPAIGNALYRAIGVRIKRLPITPESVWRALRDRSPRRASTPPGSKATPDES